MQTITVNITSQPNESYIVEGYVYDARFGLLKFTMLFIERELYKVTLQFAGTPANEFDVAKYPQYKPISEHLDKVYSPILFPL